MFFVCPMLFFLEPCTKEPYVEGDKKTVRSNTKKRDFREKTELLANVASIFLLYVGCCLFGSMYERALLRGRQENGMQQH